MRGRLLRSRLLRRLLETDTSDSCRMPWRERERGEWDQDLNYGTNAIRTFSSPCVCHLHVCVSDAEPTEYQLRTGNARMAYHVIEGALKAGLKGLVLPVVDHKD